MRLKTALLSHTILAASFMLFLGLPETGFAQAIPSTADAGRVQKDIQRELQIDPSVKTGMSPSENTQMITAPEGAEQIEFKLNDIVIEGAKHVPADKLRPLYASLIGRKVKLTEIYDAANRITQYYRDHGYLLSRAFLPEQEIHDGVIRIRVIEGFVSGYRIKNPGGIKDQIEAYAKKLMASGPVTSENLERYLLLMNDLPGVTVRSVLVPSKKIPNSAELVLTVTEKKLNGFASVDNLGTTFLGPTRLTLSAQANSLFGMTDQTNLIMLRAPDHRELSYYNAGYHQNIGDEGTKIGTNISYARTNPTLPSNMGGLLEPQGEAQTLSVDLSHPFIRSRSLNVYGGLAFDITKNKTDYAPGLSAIETKDNQRIVRANSQVSYTDTTGNYNSLNTALSRGIGGLGASDKGDTQLSRAFGDPSFTKVNFDATRLQRLYGPFTGLIGTTGQYAFNSLLASEQFGMGGNEFGRGYDSSEVTGDHGLGAKAEIAYNHSTSRKYLERYQIYGFYDIGKIWLRNKPVGQPSHESVASTGVGARFFFTPNLRGDTYIAKPLTHEVNSRGEHSDNIRFRFSLTTNF